MLPKVLIIGQPFNNYTGGGITLTNLFNGWDRDKLAVACPGDGLNNLNLHICNNYYQLGEKEKKWVFPFNFLQRKFKSGELNLNDTQTNFTVQKHLSIRKILVDYFFFPFLRYIGLFHTVSKTELSDSFSKWLSSFKPDILYIQVAKREDILFSQNLQSYLKIPMIIHNMDDWPSIISANGFLKKYWHQKIDKEFRELIDQASLLMSISEDMAAEYKRRYGRTFLPFHNSINISFWKEYQKNNYELNNPPTILYAGRIGMGINSSLKLIAKAIKNINKELGLKIKFILQTKEKSKWFDNYDCVVHKPFIPYSDLPKTFSEADLLILPYDFSKESIKFIQYSMPTKVPEYMISGTPIIIFAPRRTAIVSYAKKFEWAIPVTDSNSSELAKTIKFIIQNKTVRETISTNAKQFAEANHNTLIVNLKFREAICKVVKNS
jgi:glycosyltransferase involved in cell wall biosynthesis